jgi:hypothetical protein
MSRVTARLVDVGADPREIEWSRWSFRNEWATCGRADWMLRAIGILAGPPGAMSRKPLVLASADCAELGLRFVERSQTRTMAEAWIAAARSFADAQVAIDWDAFWQPLELARLEAAAVVEAVRPVDHREQRAEIDRLIASGTEPVMAPMRAAGRHKQKASPLKRAEAELLALSALDYLQDAAVCEDAMFAKRAASYVANAFQAFTWAKVDGRRVQKEDALRMMADFIRRWYPEPPVEGEMQ